MANVFLAWQNRTDEGTLSGGAWQASLPLANLQNRQVQKVARTADAQLASTQFVLDLGQPRSIGVLALVVHNISVTGRYRITASDTAAGLTNLLAYGSPIALNAVNWTGFSIGLTTNTGTGPSGYGSPDKLIASATSGQHYVYQSVAKAAAAKTYTFTVCAKPAGLPAFAIELDDGAGNGVYAVVNVATGAVMTSPTAFGSGLSSPVMNVVADVDGWYRVSLTVTSNTATAIRAFLILANASGNQTFTGNGTDGVLFDQAELVEGQTYYDSGWSAAWPAGMVPQALLEWEDDNFWLGTLSQNARAGFQSPLIHILPSAVNMRYWKVEIGDTGNPDGYVQIGRLFLAQGWRPGINYAFGAELGYQDPTLVETSLSGAEFFDVRSRYRAFGFELQFMTGAESYGYALELQRLAGISGEVLLVPDSDDAANMPRRAFVGRLQQLSTIPQVQPDAFRASFQIKELL